VPPATRTNPVAARSAIPATHFVPLEESPRRQPHRVTAAVAPLAVPPTSGHLPTAFAAGRRHRTPPPIRWALADRLLGRPPHIHLGPPRRPKSPRVSPGIDRAPWCGRAPFPLPLRAGKPEPGSTGESGPLQGLAPPTSSCRALRIGYRNDAALFFLGFVPLQGPPCLTLAGETDAATAEAGGGIELRSVVLSTRAVHAVTRTTRRQAWQAEDTGKPVPRPDMDPCGSCPPDPALAGPGTESLRGFTRAPLARRPGAPGVCPEPEWARRVHRSPPGLTRAGESNGTRLDRGEWAASGPCSTDESVPCAPDWIPETTPARFFLGFVPLQGPPASPLRARPTPPPPKREGASSSDPSSGRRVPGTL
jgi:hypothetical protein